jgi:hypothetical protein
MAYTASYAFVLTAILILIVISNPLTLYFIFYNKRSGSYMGLVRAMFYFFPPYTYALLFGIIVRKSTSHFDDNSQQFIQGDGFGWSDLVKKEVGEFSEGDVYESPTPLHAFGILLLDMFLCGIIVWYFDHVISSNRGTSERFYFFLTKKYWYGLCSRKKSQALKTKNKRLNIFEQLEYQEAHESDNSVDHEKMKVINDIKEGLQ